MNIDDVKEINESLSDDDAMKILTDLEKGASISGDPITWETLMDFVHAYERDTNIESTRKIINQCKDCDSTDIVMNGAVLKWDYLKQSWELWDSPEGYTYMCLDNFHENLDVIEIEEED